VPAPSVALKSAFERSRRLRLVTTLPDGSSRSLISGPLVATALRAVAGDGKQFRKARDLVAWLGLHSTGCKPTLLGISGNAYVRRLII
jgi:transposase